jgi:PPOX class probable F420-dependent enzyme
MGNVAGMASLTDPGVRELLEQPNYCVVSTLNADNSIHSSIVWVSAEGDDAVAVNSAVGRLWPTNLQRDAHISVLVFEAGNPYHFVEIRGIAEVADGADEHIDALAKKYINQDKYPFRQPGEERIKFVVRPERVRYVKQN